MEKANCPLLREGTVAAVAAESPHGRELALRWIASEQEAIAAAGWSTLAHVVSITDDARLDLPEFEQLLSQVESTLHQQPNRVRYAMNGFVIALGTYVAALTAAAFESAARIGVVSVDMGKTACQVPSAPEYLRKIQARGGIGKKRKSARC
jgi:hypothetical protein